MLGAHIKTCLVFTCAFLTCLSQAFAEERAPLFAEPKKDWVWDEDKRFTFLMERLASLEASLDAVNAAISKASGKRSARQGEASRAEANNTFMDRKGGGPMPWNQFYGTNAEKFFYHPVDPNTTYWTVTSLQQMGNHQDDKVSAGVPATQSLPVHQRPPQWDYIYRANREAQSRAEEEAQKLEGKIEALTTRRYQLEQEQADLWARLAFRVIERLNIPRKPVLRFELVGQSGESDDVQRAAALQSAARFLNAALLVINKAQKEQSVALTSVRDVIATARSNLDDELLEADAVAEDVSTRESHLGKFVALVQLLDDTANNLGESYEVAMEGDRANDESRKDRFRGLLQRSLVEYSEMLLALDELTGIMKNEWAIKINTKKRLPPVEVVWASIRPTATSVDVSSSSDIPQTSRSDQFSAALDHEAEARQADRTKLRRGKKTSSPQVLLVIGTLEDYKDHWKVGHESGVTSFDQQSGTITVRQPWWGNSQTFTFGTLTVETPWESLTFDAAATDMEAESFDMEVNGQRFSVGAAVAKAGTGVPVRIVYRASTRTVDVYVGNERVDFARIDSDSWNERLCVQFTAVGTQQCKVQMRDFRLTAAQ